MTRMLDYLRDPAAIYRQSFATVEREADLASFDPDERIVATRMIHACGMVDLASDIRFGNNAVESGLRAMHEGADILCDAQMVAHGIITDRLPARNRVVCTLNDGKSYERSRSEQTTRSAAQVDDWALHGSIVVVGNAPTALFRMIERVRDEASLPALVVGVPVGFVGAVESKELLETTSIPYITVLGRRGGSAIAAAAVNALAGMATRT